MPFKSKSQRRWMYANHPEMAEEWQAHTPKSAKLPEKVKTSLARPKGVVEGAKSLVERALAKAPPERVRDFKRTMGGLHHSAFFKRPLAPGKKVPKKLDKYEHWYGRANVHESRKPGATVSYDLKNDPSDLLYKKSSVQFSPVVLHGKASKEGKAESDFDPKALRAGSKVELEHTSNEDVAKTIAKDHLTEDSNYYKKLRKMEKKSMWMGFVDELTSIAETS